jgi:phosphoenolpyruvate carboxykinase (ATP)
MLCQTHSPFTERRIADSECESLRTVLKNVIGDSEIRLLDFCGESSLRTLGPPYPMKFMPDTVVPGVAGYSCQFFFLTCDALGVLSPIVRLST